MAVLNSWQKITRVLPGMPFGSGVDGALTISSNTTQSVANASCSGSSGSATLTLGAASTFSNNDVVMIHQTRGTNVGQWEINRISSGGGTTTLTLSKNLQYTYTDSGASQAQIVKIPMYTSITANSSRTWSSSTWNANVGGFLLCAARTGITFTGNFNSSGTDGVEDGQTSAAGGSGKGFSGGSGVAPHAAKLLGSSRIELLATRRARTAIRYRCTELVSQCSMPA